MVENHSLTQLRQATQTAKIVTFKRGEIVVASDNMHSTFLIEEGFIKRYEIKNNGSINVHGLYGPGEFIRVVHLFKTLFNQTLYSGDEIYYYEAMGAVQSRQWSDQSMIDTVHSNPEIYKDLLVIFGEHTSSDIWLLENQGLDNASKKIAHLLVMLADRYGKGKGESRQVNAPLTHQDLADLTNMARETVSIALGELKQHKLVEGQRHIFIPSIDALRHEAYS